MSWTAMDSHPDFWVYVYAYLDADGRHLYIGQTYDIPTRHGAHRQRSPWFSQAARRVVLSRHQVRAAALRAEAAAIREHRPFHNIFHNPDAKKPRTAA